MNTTALGTNKYQGQISSSDFEDKVFPIYNSTAENTTKINFSAYSQYIEKMGIYAPPGSVFRFWTNTSTYDIEIGKTFIYEVSDVKIDAIGYLGNKYVFATGVSTSAGIPYITNNSTYYDDKVYSLPNSNDRNIFIDYIVHINSTAET